MLSAAAFPAAKPALLQGAPICLCLREQGGLRQDGLMLAVHGGRSFWMVSDRVKQAHKQGPAWQIVVTDHIFAMSFNHISQGFVTAEVPAWEIHFSRRGSSQKAALQAYCQYDFAACLQMVGDLPSISPSTAHSQTAQQALLCPALEQEKPLRLSRRKREQSCAELHCPGQVRHWDGEGKSGQDRHLAQNHGFCKVSRTWVTSLQPQFQLQNAGVWSLQSLPALFCGYGASFSANVTNQF